MTSDQTSVHVKHVPPLVSLGLATAVTSLVWMHTPALLWLTEETTLVAGGVVSLALWLSVITAAGNRAKVRQLLEAMQPLRPPRDEV